MTAPGGSGAHGSSMNVQLSTIDNGVRVVTSEMPNAESVALGIWVGVGSRYEPIRLAGASHFIEHLLFKGTKTRTAREISIAIEGHGGYLNAFTGEEATCYYARVAHEHLPTATDVLTDMYRHSLFDQKELEKERGVIVEEMMMYRDQPRHLVHDMLVQSLWERHPLGRPVIGSEKSIGSVTRRDLLAFKNTRYRADNTVAAFAGRVNHEECVTMTRRMLGRVACGRSAAFRNVTSKVPQKCVSLMQKDIEQTHLALGVRLFGRNDRRKYALKVMSALLGENMSSRLFQIVREKHGLAYSVHSSIHLFSDSGAMLISAGLDRKRKNKALALVMRELKRLRERRVGGAELQRAKDYAIGQLRLSMESTSSQMMWIGDNLLSFGRHIPPEKSIAALSRVTSEDVLAVANAVLTPRRLSLAMIAPELSETDRATAGELVHDL